MTRVILLLLLTTGEAQEIEFATEWECVKEQPATPRRATRPGASSELLKKLARVRSIRWFGNLANRMSSENRHMTTKLKLQKQIGERIDAIGKDGADLQSITMFLFAHATTKERFEAVVALDAARNRRSVIECVPALKRAFWMEDGHD